MPEKILVVDDDVDSLKLIGLMLKRNGYEVVAANAGQPALAKAFEDDPDLIILDVMMPDMDGYEVCQRLRADSRTAKTPIIMFTAKTMVDDKVEAFEKGADDYLTKPTHPAELAARVKAVLARSEKGKGVDLVAGPASRGMSLGFLGVKGGVGVTSLAASVGALLAKENSTVLTDLRLGQGTLGVSLGFINAQGLATVLRHPLGDLNPGVIENNLVEHTSGLKLLLSSVNPQESAINVTPDHASELLKNIELIAHYRLFDLGASLNRLNVRLIRELNRTMIMVEPNRTTLTLAHTILREITDNVGVPSSKLSIVIFNRTQSSLQLPWQEVEEMLNQEVTAIISPAPELAYQAADAGVPLTTFQPSSIVAGQISKLVEEVVKQGG